MNKNLFIILSPFQLICAQNARDEYCGGCYNELLILNRHKPTDLGQVQLQHTTDRNWHKIKIYQDSPERGFKRLIKQIFITYLYWLKRSNYKGVYLGEARSSWQNKMADCFGQKKIFLDDGSASIILINKMLEFSDKLDQKVSMYSVFGNSAICKHSQGRIIENRRFFRNFHVSKPLKKEVVFIGQSLSETGYITTEQEFNWLASIWAQYQGYNVSYVRHRNDCKEKIKMISTYGIKIISLQTPIEMHYMNESIIPHLFIGWFSTALFTLKKAYPQCNVIFHNIQKPNKEIESSSDIKIIYDFAERNGYTVEQLSLE